MSVPESLQNGRRPGFLIHHHTNVSYGTKI